MEPDPRFPAEVSVDPARDFEADTRPKADAQARVFQPFPLSAYDALLLEYLDVPAPATLAPTPPPTSPPSAAPTPPPSTLAPTPAPSKASTCGYWKIGKGTTNSWKYTR